MNVDLDWYMALLRVYMVRNGSTYIKNTFIYLYIEALNSLA